GVFGFDAYPHLARAILGRPISGRVSDEDVLAINNILTGLRDSGLRVTVDEISRLQYLMAAGTADSRSDYLTTIVGQDIFDDSVAEDETSIYVATAAILYMMSDGKNVSAANI